MLFCDEDDEILRKYSIPELHQLRDMEWKTAKDYVASTEHLTEMYFQTMENI